MTGNPVAKILFGLCLIAIAAAVKVDHLSSETGSVVFFTILDTMMVQYQLPRSKQIPNCFSDSQKDALAEAVQSLTNAASTADATTLRSFPALYSSYMN